MAERYLAILVPFPHKFITSIDRQTGPFRIHVYLLSSIQQLQQRPASSRQSIGIQANMHMKSSVKKDSHRWRRK
jgi:hypothetical protein